MARLVRMCVKIGLPVASASWPGSSLGRTHISEIALAINALTAGGERSPAVMARLVRAICRGTDGLNPGHRSPLSGASLCRLQYRYEMCVRPSGSLGLNSAILVEAIDAPAATAGSGAAEAKCTISIIRQGQNGIFQS